MPEESRITDLGSRKVNDPRSEIDAPRFYCVRIDLDYVPWDTPDAQQYGHGEPAVLIRLLELGRRMGARWHFFASERTLRAFPTEADAVLNDGHNLDYLAKHPSETVRIEEATRLFSKAGHVVRGWAIREAWPPELLAPEGVEFFSGPSDAAPPGRLFPVVGRTLQEALRAGTGLRGWMDETVPTLQSHGGTIVVSPQVLARVDPRLTSLEEILGTMRKAAIPMRTLREMTSGAGDVHAP